MPKRVGVTVIRLNKKTMFNHFGKSIRTRSLLGLRALGAVLGAGLHTALNALGVQSTADDVVTDAGEVLDTDKFLYFGFFRIFFDILQKINWSASSHFLRKEKTMPTFNQLVRKGREQATYKSNAPAMQYGLNTLKNKETDLPSPQNLAPYLERACIRP